MAQFKNTGAFLSVRVGGCIALVLVFATCVGGSSSGSAEHVRDWRPPDVRLLGMSRYPGSFGSGGGTVRAFETTSTFDDVVQIYSKFVTSRGGTAFRSGYLGWRFAADGDCAIISAWKGRDPRDALEIHLSEGVTEALDRSAEGYVELTPNDCRFAG